jgi:hypothetical protein
MSGVPPRFFDGARCGRRAFVVEVRPSVYGLLANLGERNLAQLREPESEDRGAAGVGAPSEVIDLSQLAGPEADRG